MAAGGSPGARSDSSLPPLTLGEVEGSQTAGMVGRFHWMALHAPQT
jgi:hypothetical protein